MKLLLKTSLLILLITLAVFGLGSLVSYRIFEREIQVETDRFLKGRFYSLQERLEAGELARSYTDDKLSIDTLSFRPDTVGRASFRLTDTLVMHRYLKRLENNRKLVGYARVDSTYLQLSLYDVIVESDDIMDGVVRSLTWLFVLLGGGVIIGSFLISRILLRPFQQTLHEISRFNLTEARPLELPRTSTTEFNQLNRFIRQMTDKMRGDYQRVKEFSENASHEIQTPLAVAKGKLELLSQGDDLTEEHLAMIGTAYQAVDEVSKLAKSLMLLTKIENAEFSDFRSIDASRQLRQTVTSFDELIALKALTLTVDIHDGISLNNHPTLFRILINNLITNAIRHNQPEGVIHVRLSATELSVVNTGAPLTTAPEQLFERFKKNQQSSESLGLGLSIVKKICDISGYSVQYQYAEGWHTVRVFFPTDLSSELPQNAYPFDSEFHRRFTHVPPKANAQ